MPEAAAQKKGSGHAAPRTSSGTLTALLLPGLADLRSGRPLTGLALLSTWGFLVTVLVTRAGRIGDALRGVEPGRGSACALVLGLTAVWGVSLASAARQGRRTVRISTPWRRLTHGFAQNRAAVVGVFVLGGLAWAAVLAPFLSPANPLEPMLRERLQAPSSLHLLGTDQNGRDVLSRILYGARISLGVAFLAVALASTVGTLLGAVAGYVGGRVDRIITAGIDTVLAVPRIVLLIVLVGAVGQASLTLLVLVLGLTQWPLTARMIRAEVLSIRERDFVKAAEALGFSRTRVLLRHVIPNALGPVIVAAALGVGNTIILEAGLSFLGLGVQPPTPSWGEMVARGRSYMHDAWWLSTYAGLAIVITVVAANMVGDGIRQGLDPRSGPDA